MKRITPEDAFAAFTKAAALVKAGKLDEARAMKDELLPSDWAVIERRIEAERK